MKKMRFVLVITIVLLLAFGSSLSVLADTAPTKPTDCPKVTPVLGTSLPSGYFTSTTSYPNLGAQDIKPDKLPNLSSCTQIGYLKIDLSDSMSEGFYYAGSHGSSTIGTNDDFKVYIWNDGNTSFTWKSMNHPVYYVYAKGGSDGGNLYTYSPPAYSDCGLSQPGGGWSHIVFYYCVPTFVAEPAISVVKTPSATSAVIGDTITYNYGVTNTGDVTLTGVTAVDDLLGAITLDKDTLAPGESTSGSLTHTVVEADLPGPIVNTVDTEGWYVEQKVTDDDDASVSLTPGPAISVTKTPSTLNAKIGDTITYNYVVTNTGDVTLTGVTAVDDLLGAITLDKDTLAPGESTSGSLTHTVVEADLPGPIFNTVIAEGWYNDGEESVKVSDNDDVNVFIGVNPLISVTKDADDFGPELGDVITYTYVVTNTGDVTLVNVKAVDDKLGEVSLDKTTLAPGESATGTLTYTTVVADYPSELKNTVDAEGYYGEIKVTDSASLNIVLPEYPQAGPVYIRKVLEYAEGAEVLASENDLKFTIEVRDSTNTVVLTQQISVNDGQVALELEEGTYTLHEINIPTGFSLVGFSEQTITVTTDSQHDITVTNKKGYLPPTGGLNLFGLGALLGLSGLLLKRKQKR